MRNSDAQTKIISVRIPMDKYFEILKETIDLKISISDYLLFKLYEKVPMTDEKIDEMIKDSLKRIEERKQNKI